MIYENVAEAVFLQRPNRFIAHVLLDGEERVAHVKNTGRCRELLVPGATVYVQRHDNPKRRTDCSLIAVKKGDRLINMDSQAPNKVVEEALRSGALQLPGMEAGAIRLRREATYGQSRLDFYLEAGGIKAYAEVKGVTLEEDGIVLFPDAPTQRGTKHLQELVGLVGEGYGAYVILVVQMQDVRYFVPNRRTDPAFADALLAARHRGVQVLAFDCRVAPDELVLGKPVQVRLV